MFIISFSGFAQTKKQTETFEISIAEFNKILDAKPGTKYKSKNNVLNKATVTLNNTVIENQQVKLKLSFFKNSHLIIQVNGKDSKLIFILSDDDSVFYNGTFMENKIIMKKCQKDDLFID